MAHLARQVTGLSELTRTEILHRVELITTQVPARSPSARADDRGATAALGSKSDGSSLGHRSLADRLKRIEQLLCALRRTYKGVNKLMAAGASAGQTDTDGDALP